MSYFQDAKDDAADLAEYLQDQIVEQLLDKGKASDDFRNDYTGADSYFHESYVDKSYSLTEADSILSDLHEYEETDSGLWEGLEPREAISAQAAWTYGAAVEMQWRELIESVNDSYDEEVEEWKEVVSKEQGKEVEPTTEEIKEIVTRLINNFKE